MWQSIIKAWGNKRVDPGGDTRRKRDELNASIRYSSYYTMTILLYNNNNKIIFHGILCTILYKEFKNLNLLFWNLLCTLFKRTNIFHWKKLQISLKKL